MPTVMKSRGFTIAELAIAVAVLALLLFSAMVPFSAQVELRNVADTRRTMDSIREAIIGFAQANGRLPCPANGSIASGVANAGIEKFDGTSCVAAFGAFGVVPWATLGTPETDSWGRRFSYRVSPAFADAIFAPSPPNPPGTLLATWNSLKTAYVAPLAPPTYLPQNVSTPTSPGPANQTPQCDLTTAPTLSSFAICTLGDITVFTRSSPGTAATPLVAVVPAVIISHGKNGYGAWQSSGGQLTLPPAGSDEAANAAGNISTLTGSYPTWTFYSRTPTSAASGCVDPAPLGAGGPPFCEFDDIVATITTNALIARMVAAGKLP